MITLSQESEYAYGLEFKNILTLREEVGGLCPSRVLTRYEGTPLGSTWLGFSIFLSRLFESATRFTTGHVSPRTSAGNYTTSSTRRFA
jgi:hypothetical protein